MRVLIVDDEKSARLYLRKLIGQRRDCTVAGECRNASEARELIITGTVDIVLLDIQMPGHTGLQLIEEIGAAKMPMTIFTTAYDEYSIRAFELHAVGYLLKPFTPDRFFTALDHACRLVEQSRQSNQFNQLLGDAISYLKNAEVQRQMEGLTRPSREPVDHASDSRNHLSRLLIPGPHQSTVVAASEIDWIAACDYYSEIHCGSKTHLIRASLEWFEKNLDPELFLRIHRSYIVRVDVITSVRRGESGITEVVVKGGQALPLSRRKRAAILDDLKKRMGP